MESTLSTTLGAAHRPGTVTVDRSLIMTSVRGDVRYQVLQNRSWIQTAPPAVLTQKFPSTAVGVIRPGLCLVPARLRWPTCRVRATVRRPRRRRCRIRGRSHSHRRRGAVRGCLRTRRTTNRLLRGDSQDCHRQRAGIHRRRNRIGAMSRLRGSVRVRGGVAARRD